MFFNITFFYRLYVESRRYEIFVDILFLIKWLFLVGLWFVIRILFFVRLIFKYYDLDSYWVVVKVWNILIKCILKNLFY